MLQQALFIVLFISSQILSINGLETFYEWMEKNSYICQDNNSFEPSFLTNEEAIQFNCESLCGNPLLTSHACSRPNSDDNNSSPICSEIPPICMENFIQEFNDEKSFLLLLNNAPFVELSTTTEHFVPELINESGENDDIDIQIITTTGTPFTTTEERTFATEETTTTPKTTTERKTTTPKTTSTISSITTNIIHIKTSIAALNFARELKTIIGFRFPFNTFTQAIATTTPLSTRNFTTETSEVDENKIVRDSNSFNTQLPDNTKPCFDLHVSCPYWAALDECKKNPRYMNDVCRKVCGICK